jgi:E3 ubiquitin-protein ligase RNF14
LLSKLPIQSIYPDVCISNDAGPSGRMIKLEIPVELSPAHAVTIVPPLPNNHSTSHQPHTHAAGCTTNPLTALPPFLLALTLPPQYPLHASPHITAVASTHAWFPTSKIRDLHTLLASTWTQDSQGVLYTWVEFLHSGDFLCSLSLTSSTRKTQSSSSSNTITIINPLPSTLLPLLESHNARAQDATFAETSYPCAICLSAHKGRHCVRLACAHVFCRSCLSDFWGSCIAEGDIGRVGCPDPSCVKAGHEAGEDDIVRVVQEEELRRWKWLRTKRALERDPGMIHCPVVFCQTPVPSPKLEGDDESGWARLRTCPTCEYAFCAFCRRTWHGPISECPLRVTETFVLEYLALPDGDVRRTEIERRWGRANVRRLVEKHEDDRKNREWMEKSTMGCPGCGVHVEKSFGCNHVSGVCSSMTLVNPPFSTDDLRQV